MKIRLSGVYASPHRTAQAGESIDVSAEEGAQLISGRHGIEVADASPADTAETPQVSRQIPDGEWENASVSAPENAARKPGARGSRGRSSISNATASDESD